MPYPAQIHYDTLISTAAALIEAHGVEHVSLRAVAEQLGVKAPSLYRHVADKHTLLRAVNQATIQQLFAVLYAALEATPGSPSAKLHALAVAYRRFAHEHPALYELAFLSALALRPDDAMQQQAVLPLQRVMAAHTGDEQALAALRGALGLVHGWVLLELNGNFRRGGDLDADFRRAFTAFLEGWRCPVPRVED